MYMYNIKLFAKNEKESEILIQTITISSRDMGLEFGIEMFCHANNEKRKTTYTEGVELPNQEKIRTLPEKETYVVHSLSFQTFLYRHLKLS